jgi:hypothetical protein
MTLRSQTIINMIAKNLMDKPNETYIGALLELYAASPKTECFNEIEGLSFDGKGVLILDLDDAIDSADFHMTQFSRHSVNESLRIFKEAFERGDMSLELHNQLQCVVDDYAALGYSVIERKLTFTGAPINETKNIDEMLSRYKDRDGVVDYNIIRADGELIVEVFTPKDEKYFNELQDLFEFSGAFYSGVVSMSPVLPGLKDVSDYLAYIDRRSKLTMFHKDIEFSAR